MAGVRKTLERGARVPSQGLGEPEGRAPRTLCPAGDFVPEMLLGSLGAGSPGLGGACSAERAGAGQGVAVQSRSLFLLVRRSLAFLTEGSGLCPAAH